MKIAAGQALERTRDAVVGDVAERAIENALRNACLVVAQETVAKVEDRDAAVTVLLEHLTGASPSGLSALNTT